MSSAWTESRKPLQLSINRRSMKQYIRPQSADIRRPEKSFVSALNYGEPTTVYMNLARLYLRENQPSRALEFLGGKIQDGSVANDDSAAYLKGAAFFDLKQYEQAVVYYEQSIRGLSSYRGPDFEQAMRDLAVSYSRLGRYSEADQILADLVVEKGEEDPVISYIRVR